MTKRAAYPGASQGARGNVCRRLACLAALFAAIAAASLHAHAQQAAPPPADAQNRPAAKASKELIAVMELEPMGSDKVQASAVTDRLREELLKSGRFTVVDRQQMSAVLDEQAFQQTGCTSTECAVQAGKVLGVHKLVTGHVTKLDERHWMLSADMIDVETAETQRSETLPYQGTFFDLLSTGAGQLGARLAAPGPAGRASSGFSACRKDARKFCAGVQPGGGRIVQCLKGHESELAPACRQQLAPKPNACRDDTQRFCAGVQPGAGRIAQCLKGRESELAAACKQQLAPRSNACQADARALCAGVQPGAGRIVACLKQHQGQLSSACQAQLGRS